MIPLETAVARGLTWYYVYMSKVFKKIILIGKYSDCDLSLTG